MFACWLLIVVVFFCLQNVFSAFDLYLPSFKVFKSFLILPFSMQFVPIISWIFFFFFFKSVIGSFLKISWKFMSVSKIFQFYLMVFGNIWYYQNMVIPRIQNPFYVIRRGIPFGFCYVSFSLSCNVVFHSLLLLRKSTWFELIRLIWMAWVFRFYVKALLWISFPFCISSSVIFRDVDIIQRLEMQCCFSKCCNQIL